jgi:hypothetical protein
MSFADATTETLTHIRANLLAGMDKVAGHLDAGTFDTIPPKRASPPSQSGQLTLALLNQVNAELDRRRNLMMPIVLCDVDGTVALMGKGESGRRHFYEWHRVAEDDPNVPVINLVQVLRAAGYPIVFLSGRDEVCREATNNWLIEHGAAQAGDALYMRPHKDNRPDHEVKLEIYKRDIEPNNTVAWVIDDRDQVVRMWRSLGLTVLQVADGAF